MKVSVLIPAFFTKPSDIIYTDRKSVMLLEILRLREDYWYGLDISRRCGNGKPDENGMRWHCAAVGHED